MKFSIIIPACNEGLGIGRTLRRIGLDNNPDVDMLVMCNGCTDNTAIVARDAAPASRIFESNQPGKALAINRGLDLARYETVLVVDADIDIDGHALRAIAQALQEEGVMAASPAATFDLSDASPIVRRYYGRFVRHSYLAAGVGGSGVYGLSPLGLQHIGRLPNVIADDHFIRCATPLDAQRRVTQAKDGTFVSAVITPPKNLRALFRAEIRSRRGDRQVHELCAPPIKAPYSGPRSLDTFIYYTIKCVVRLAVWLSPPQHSQSWKPVREI